VTGSKHSTGTDPVILIFGGTGLLGRELCRRLKGVADVVSPSSSVCDISDPALATATIRAVRPDIIVNAAAYTAVDRAEFDQDRAYRVNFHAVGNIARTAASIDCPVVHFSTDYVFNGRKRAPYVESDVPDPLNVYGASKLAGDLALIGSSRRHLLLRTSWLYGRDGSGFVKTILDLAADRYSLDVVADQVGTPTSADRVAEVTSAIVAHCLAALRSDSSNNFEFGLYNICASGATSRFDYARTIVSQAVARGLPLRLNADAIKPITAASLKGLAKRPANSTLACAKLSNAFEIELPHWQIDLTGAIDVAVRRC
jgi:dTDP-4-dehydrorhamnose reductase